MFNYVFFVLAQLAVITAGGLGYWLGQKGKDGMLAEIKQDIAWVKDSLLIKEAPVVTVTPTTTPVVTSVPVVVAETSVTHV